MPSVALIGLASCFCPVMMASRHHCAAMYDFRAKPFRQRGGTHFACTTFLCGFGLMAFNSYRPKYLINGSLQADAWDCAELRIPSGLKTAAKSFASRQSCGKRVFAACIARVF